jgi:hypothetical protein
VTYAPIQHGPLLDEDERRLAMLDDLIKQAREQERQEAQRRAEEARQRAERGRALGDHTLDDLERLRVETAARIAERQTHLRVDAEGELLRRRAERLRADVEKLQTSLSTTMAELAVVETKLAG